MNAFTFDIWRNNMKCQILRIGYVDNSHKCRWLLLIIAYKYFIFLERFNRWSYLSTTFFLSLSHYYLKHINTSNEEQTVIISNFTLIAIDISFFYVVIKHNVFFSKFTCVVVHSIDIS